MEQYARTLVKSLTKVMDKKKIDKVFTKRLQNFITTYFQMMNVIGIRNFDVYNNKIDSEKLTKMAYLASLKQADSPKFACNCKTQKCMRTKMACNIIDNIMMLVPLSSLCDNEYHRLHLSEVINYANNDGGYNYLKNVADAMYGKAGGPTSDSELTTIKLEEKMKKYHAIKLQLARYF